MRRGRVRLTLFFPLHNSNFLYRIENVVCYPFRTANLVDNGTKEGQIGEGCLGGVDDEVGPVGVDILTPVDPVQPGDALVLHEGEVDIRDAAIAGVQVGKALVHHHTVLGHRQYPGVEEYSCLA